MKLHSIIDRMTSSSAEIYVIKTDKTVDEVRKILQDIWHSLTDLPFTFTDITKYEDSIDKSHLIEKRDGFEQYGYDGKWHTYLKVNMGEIEIKVPDIGYDWDEPEEFADRIREVFPSLREYQMG
jgi:hypothetical protein